MYRKGSFFIIIFCLLLVLVITLTSMITNNSKADIAKKAEENNQNKARIEPKIDGNENLENKENGEIKEDQQIKKAGEIKKTIEAEESKDEAKTEEIIDLEKSREKVTNDIQVDGANSNKKEDKKELPIATEKKKDDFKNKETSNTNILCLGIAENKLEMISIYTINENNKKSAAVFFPTRITVKINGELQSLQEIYQKLGIQNLCQVLSSCLAIDLPTYMVVDKRGLEELSNLLGPIYVENENIDIPNLFVHPVSSKDDQILQKLADEVCRPKMILQLPKLVNIFMNNVETNLSVSSLWNLYRDFKNLNHAELSKKVLWGEKVEMNNEEFWFIDPYVWHNVIYEMTQ